MADQGQRSDWKGQLRKAKQALAAGDTTKVRESTAPPSWAAPGFLQTKQDVPSLPRKGGRLYGMRKGRRAKPPLLPKWARQYCEENGIDPADAVMTDGRLEVCRRVSPPSRPTPSATSPTTVPGAPGPQPLWPWVAGATARPRFTAEAQVRQDAQQWLSSGTRVQTWVGTAPPRGQVRVLVGLDVGTAYTKVVAKVGASDRYAVSFDKAVDCSDRFLLPAVLSIDVEGAAWLGEIEGCILRFDDLKFRVIQRDDRPDEQAAFVAFMALVLRASRAWLFENRRALLTSRSIDWGYNVGVPTLPWESTGFREKYQKLVEAALCASVTSGPVKLETCRGYLRHLPQQTALRERISVFPEFAAQITGYVNSPRRRDGPLLLVDVGAGTLDVTMFNVFQPPLPANDNDVEEAGLATAMPAADTRFPIWDARVERLGSHYLAIARSLATGRPRDDLAEVGEKVESLQAYCHRTGADLEGVQLMEKQFSRAVSGEVAGVIRTTKVERYSRFPWQRTAVPTFICGGGARYPLYERAVQDAARRFPVMLEHLPLPVPESLRNQGIGDNLFDRLSVAYGLSFEPPDIGEVVPSHQIEDQPRPPQAGGRPPVHGIDLTDRDQAE